MSHDTASPCQVDLVEGQTYKYCKCGQSKTRPLCDGSQGGGCIALEFKARATESALLCNCGETGDPPYCDGTHNII